MKPEDINRAIAEHCGWKFTPGLSPTWQPPNGGLAYATDNIHRPPYPNYNGDLNAMHEAEKTFDLNEKKRFAYTLYMMPGFGGLEYGDGIYYPTLFSLMHTTAAQRAEAFLRTVGKWNDQ